MVKILKKPTFDEFIHVNEYVAHTSPMMTHYHSSNPFERWLWKQKKKIIREILESIPYKTIIDLGCGDGGMLEVVDEEKRYTGVDISPTQIKGAQEHIKKLKRRNAEVKVGDILNLKVKDNSYDVSLLCDITEHVLDPQKLFKEVKRITKKNGYIIFSIPNEFLWESMRAALLRFPLRSPDHINAIYPKDMAENFKSITKKIFVPIGFSSHASLIHIYVVKNVK